MPLLSPQTLPPCMHARRSGPGGFLGTKPLLQDTGRDGQPQPPDSQLHTHSPRPSGFISKETVRWPWHSLETPSTLFLSVRVGGREGHLADKTPCAAGSPGALPAEPDLETQHRGCRKTNPEPLRLSQGPHEDCPQTARRPCTSFLVPQWMQQLFFCWGPVSTFWGGLACASSVAPPLLLRKITHFGAGAEKTQDYLSTPCARK